MGVLHHDGHLTLMPWPGLLGVHWFPPLAVGWAMVGVTTLGFAFAWWARIYLGRLWSGSITRKEGHHVVDTGPYALVRHPIYTGIILSAIATAIAIGAVHAYLGAVLLIIGYWIKAKLEERFLQQKNSTPQAYRTSRIAAACRCSFQFGPKERMSDAHDHAVLHCRSIGSGACGTRRG